MTADRIDFTASRPHYVDHLVPVWLALPPERRGEFYVSRRNFTADRVNSYGIMPTPWKDHERPPKDPDTPIVAGGWLDARDLKERPLVLMEHGAGQSYSNANAGYAGGANRENVLLFICPNEFAAARNRASCHPDAVVVVVGCPKLDRWLVKPPKPDAKTVAMSWHWGNPKEPEARGALRHYKPHLKRVVEEWEDAGLTVLGHAHPRALNDVRGLYRTLGIELVPDFNDIVDRASIYSCDNSSTMFEMAALGRSVVVVNSPEYRKHAHHGLRFWSHAGIGPQVDNSAQLADAVLMCAREHPKAPPELIADVYGPLDGHASDRAAAAIVQWMETR